MKNTEIPWKHIGITLGLAMTAFLLPVITDPYFEKTKAPDDYGFIVLVVSFGLLFLAALLVPITIAKWLYKRNQNRSFMT